MSITFTDVFCGAGGSSLGLTAAGLQLRLAANHWDRAIETHSANFADAEHLCADVSNYDMRRLPSTDVLWASPECFPAGTLITTEWGQLPIERVEVGDLVLTHTGRWRSVVRTQSKVADTVMVVGQGHSGLEVTPTHRFWLRASRRTWHNDVRDYRRDYESPGFAPIGEALARQACWASPNYAAPLAAVDLPLAFGLDQVAAHWLLGRWLGDGSLTMGRGRADVVLTCGRHEADALRERLAATGAAWSERELRTAVAFHVVDSKARDWLLEHCGHGAAVKQLPGWVLGQDRAVRQALLDGYLSADGHVGPRRTNAHTVSRALAISVRLLAESLDHRVSMSRDRRTSWAIEGRTGTALQQYRLEWENTPTSRETTADGLHAWSRVRKLTAGQRAVEVFNIEVEDDHSYIAEGIVVANCTWHSPAGGRKKLRAQLDLLDDYVPTDGGVRSRATMLDVIRATEVHRYGHVIVENVVEVTDWPLFDWWLDGMRQLDYTPQLLSLNSAHAGGETNPHAPQWRDRIYVVFTRAGMPVPDLAPRPVAWCADCDVDVPAVQWWKKDRGRKVGKYRQQYVYRCPNAACRHTIVEPYVLPAAAAIDWSDLGQRIGDRKRPLAAATMRRIRAGLELFAGTAVLVDRRDGNGADGPQVRPADFSPIGTVTARGESNRTIAIPPGALVPAGGTWNDDPTGLDRPMRTRTAREAEGVLTPPVVLNVNHHGDDGRPYPAGTGPLAPRTTKIGDGIAMAEPFVTMLRGPANRPTAIDEPLATVATGNNHYLTAPEPFVTMLRRNGATTGADEPLATLAAAGNHHALTVPPGAYYVKHFTPRGDNWSGMSKDVRTEPLGAITGADHHSLVIPYRRGAKPHRAAAEPISTIATVEQHGLLHPTVDVEDCYFRMLKPREHLRAQRFHDAYVVLGNQGEQTMQAGNAVSANAAQWIGERIAAALGGAA